MNPYNRPPGSSRCPHTNPIPKRINARAMGLYCRQCGFLTGWWTDAQDNTNYEKVISGPVTDYTEKEMEELR